MADQSVPLPQPPDWVQDSKILSELRLYLRTWRAVTRAPWAFARRWAKREQEAMNPLTFFAFSVSAMVFLQAVAEWTWRAPAGPWTSQVLRTINGPLRLHVTLAQSLFLAALLHLTALRRSGYTLSVTVGALLFAVGGPGTLVNAVAIVVGRALIATQPDARLGLGLLGLQKMLLSSILIGATLGGAHGRRMAPVVAWSLLGYLLVAVVIAKVAGIS
jgi:hypothetical protein